MTRYRGRPDGGVDELDVDWRVALAVVVILVSFAGIILFPDVVPLTYIWAAAFAASAFAAPRTTLLIGLLATAVSTAAYVISGSGLSPIFWLRVLGFGVLVAVAVEIARQRVRILSRLRTQASTDPLTGLANRRLLTERLDAQLSLRAHDRYVAVVYADLDDFKAVNDSLGHGGGDEVLLLASQRLLSCVGAADTVARVGGDEFIIAIPEAPTVEEVIEMCDRMIDAFTTPFTTTRGTAKIGVTLGVAIARHSSMSSPTELIETADDALLERKAAAPGGHLVRMR